MSLDMVQLLRDRGINPTQQRLEIAQILLPKPQHLSADQILVQVNRERTVASKATVYNTLSLFAEKGLINEVIVDPTKVFYDSNTHAHYHFYNIDTNSLMDVECEQIPVDNLPALPEGTVAAGVDIIIRVRNSCS